MLIESSRHSQISSFKASFPTVLHDRIIVTILKERSPFVWMSILKCCNKAIFFRTFTYVTLSRAVGRIWIVSFTEAVRPHGDSFCRVTSLLKNYAQPCFDTNSPEAFCVVSHSAGATLFLVVLKVLHFNCISAYIHVYSIIPFVCIPFLVFHFHTALFLTLFGTNCRNWSNI
jgi:hypothetical protein